jgi:hypothetical protein
MGKALEHIGIGNNFLNRTPIAQQLTEMIDKWDCIKQKSFSTTKETSHHIERQPIGENCYMYNKGLIIRIYRELKNTKLPRN